MPTIGLLRVKDESRWIERSIRSISGICERVVVMDDGSTDDTREIAAACGATVLCSPFTGLDETRDKNWLLEQANPEPGDWCLLIDGDEELHRDDAGVVTAATRGNAQGVTLKILYLWDDERKIRTDGVYGRFTRPSLFRFDPARQFKSTRNGGNFHCGSTPHGTAPIAHCEARLLHYGYLHREDRIRKYHWYRQMDPGNAYEDGYRHVAQGDLPEIPAGARLRHAGPMQFASL